MSTNDTPTTESLWGGIAVLQANDDAFTDPGPYHVNGIAMPDDVITHGGSGETRQWPPETLEAAAKKLEGKSIVKDWHPATPEQAPASAIIGQVTAAGYEPSVGIRFEGEITDQDIAQKIDRNYLEVSTRPLIDGERYDASEDRYIVESIADFLDIAVVDRGAADGNSVEIGRNPSVAALAMNALGGASDSTAPAPTVESLKLAEARTPSYDGRAPASERSWPDGGPNLGAYIDAYYDQADTDPDDQPSDWSDLPQTARNWIAAKSFLGEGSADTFDGGVSFPVVFPDGDLSEDGLRSARSMRGQGTSDQQARSLEQKTRSILNNNFDADIDAPESNAAELVDRVDGLIESAEDENWNIIPKEEYEEQMRAHRKLQELKNDYPEIFEGDSPSLDALQEDEDDDDDAEEQSESESEDGGDDSDGDGAETRLDTWSTFLATLSDGDTDSLNFNALYRLLAAEIEGVGAPDVGEALPEDVFSDSTSADDIKERIAGLVGGTDGDGDGDTEANMLQINKNDSGLTAALKHSVSLTGSTPDRCGSIKDGAQTIGSLHESIAHDVLPQQGNGEKVDISEGDGDHVSRQALGLEDTAEDIEREPEVIDIDSDAVSQAALGLNDRDEDGEMSDPATEAYGERIRAAAEGEDVQNTEAKTSVDVGDDPITHHLLGIGDSGEDSDDEDPVVKSFGDRVRAAVEGEDVQNTEAKTSIDLGDDPIVNHLLGTRDDEDEEIPDAATKAYGEWVRAATEGEDIQNTEAKTSVDVGDDPITHHLLGIDERGEDSDDEDPVVKSFGERVRKSIDDAKEPDRTDIDEDALAGSAVSGEPATLSVEISGGDDSDSDD